MNLGLRTNEQLNTKSSPLGGFHCFIFRRLRLLLSSFAKTFSLHKFNCRQLRPALVIHEGEKDVVVAFISSKVPSKLSEADVLITEEKPGFKTTGLKINSVIKLDKVATLLKGLILGEPGELNEELRKEVNQKLKMILEL